jgi:hypothetical protein
VPVWVDTFVRTKFPVSPQQHPFFKSVSYIHAIGTLNGCLPLLLADRIVAERVPHDKSAAKVADMPPTFRPRRSEDTRLGNLLEFKGLSGFLSGIPTSNRVVPAAQFFPDGFAHTIRRLKQQNGLDQSSGFAYTHSTIPGRL